MTTNAWQFPKNPVSATIEEKSDRVDRSKERLWKKRKAKLSKGMQQMIDNFAQVSQDSVSTRPGTMGAYYDTKEEFEKKIAYIQEENRRMKAQMAEMGLRFDIYPIKV